MEDDLRTGTPYRISGLRQQPSGVDRRCQIWPIRGYTRFWYTVMSFLKLISQAFARPLPQPPLVFFPLFRSLSFSLALHYLNAWNRLNITDACAQQKNKPLLLLQQYQKQRPYLPDTSATEQNESNNSGYLILGVGGLIISALGVYYQREVIMASFANRAGTNSTPKKEPVPEEDFSPRPTKSIREMD